jgi:ribosome-associated protein
MLSEPRRYNIYNRFKPMTVTANQPDKTVSADSRIVEISREPVELYKILKFEGMAASGGQAKGVVAAGQVLVNGKIETQKRKKIVAGDTIEFNNETICIKLASAIAAEIFPPATEVETPAKKQVNEATNDNSPAVEVDKK